MNFEGTQEMGNDSRRRTVLVTGAARGIGLATARKLAGEGYEVWPAVRAQTDAVRIDREIGGRVPLRFDLTDHAAIAEAGDVVSAAGPLFGLTAIAGDAYPGPLEHLPLSQFERQLAVNVTGQLALIRAVLPALRAGARRWGRARIVVMGSLDARLVGPFFGAYAASKHALVGLTDALRCELRPDGIDVCLLEPGLIDTDIWSRGIARLAELGTALPDGGGRYRSLMEFADHWVPRIAAHGQSPDRVARVVAEMLRRPRPAPRRAVGVDAHLIAALLGVLPPRVIHRLTSLPITWSARHHGGAAAGHRQGSARS